MEIILRSARIVNTDSPFHLQVKDIHISNGKIKKIATRIDAPKNAKEIKQENLHVSLGFVCLNTFLADPGYEYKETIESGCAAAAAGGFTHICAMPNTQPVAQTKAQIEYVLRKSAGQTVSVHPVGALTNNCEGKELSEMYDMHHTGAIAFTDGLHASPPAGLVERAMLYAKAFDGLIMLHPEDKSISKNGVMHEGVTSTKLGLPAAPAIAEEIAVNRDLYVLEYTQSKLHFLDISLKRSVELIRAAKKKGLEITCSVNAYNLLLDETSVGNYQTNYKVNPHLRSREDIAALTKGIADGTIDTITSAHQPHEEDGKKLEFDKAEFGMIGLETCFAVANTALQDKVETTQTIKTLAENPRTILGIGGAIAEGEPADLTLFNPTLEWIFEEKHIRSKSKNTPFVGYRFTGKVVGIIHNNQLQLNP
ncbi:MAG: dihydroorotase [Chitinophagales bacterium]|nr:dihydroorotase [Chitinophagales bacterium]